MEAMDEPAGHPNPDVLKTIVRPDGKRRILIIRRLDGWYGYQAETAEREARATIGWLSGCG